MRAAKPPHTTWHGQWHGQWRNNLLRVTGDEDSILGVATLLCRIGSQQLLKQPGNERADPASIISWTTIGKAGKRKGTGCNCGLFPHETNLQQVLELLTPDLADLQWGKSIDACHPSNTKRIERFDLCYFRRHGCAIAQTADTGQSHFNREV